MVFSYMPFKFAHVLQFSCWPFTCTVCYLNISVSHKYIVLSRDLNFFCKDHILSSFNIDTFLIVLEDVDHIWDFAALDFTALGSEIKTIVIQLHKEDTIPLFRQRSIDQQDAGLDTAVGIEHTGRERNHTIQIIAIYKHPTEALIRRLGLETRCLPGR